MKNKVAPCSGLLVNPLEALEAIKVKTVDLPAAQRQLHEAQVFYERALDRANQQTDEALAGFEALQTLITAKVRPVERSIFEEPLFWGVFAFVAGAGVGYLISQGVSTP